MKEAELNTIIKNSLLTEFSYKIPDAGFSKSIKRPFDGFGIYKGLPLYWEAKMNKSFGVLDLQKIEDHQIANLLRIQRTLKVPNYCWLIWGVKVNNKTRIYIFDDMELINERRNNEKNILLKELKTITNYGMVCNKLIDFSFYEGYNENSNNRIEKIS